MNQLFSSQLVMITGKGGVGKSTLTASLARLGAESGKRVLVAEVGNTPDAPSVVHAALRGEERPGSLEPVEVEPNIRRVYITPEIGHRAFLRDVLPLGFLADRALKAEPLKRFLNAAPAFAELGILYRGMQLLQQKRRNGEYEHQLLLLDAPATGHALAFASLPEAIMRLIPAGPIFRACRDGLAILRDPKRTTSIVATLPEALPATEALELKAGLERNQLHVGAVVVNQVPFDPFSPDEYQALRDCLAGDLADVRLLGERSLGRLNRAQAALTRLQEGVGKALITVREHVDRGPALVDAIATELAAV